MNDQPHNTEAERAIIGCCLLDHRARVTVLSRIKRDDFYEPSHRIMYGAIEEISATGGKPDIVTVSNYLIDRNESAAVTNISGTTAVVPSVRNAEHYANIVREAAQKRKLIQIGHQISASAAMQNGISVKALTASLYDDMLDMLTLDQSTGAMDLKEAIQRTQSMQDEYNKADYYSRMKTGFAELDQILNLLPGTMTAIGAKTSAGKSAFALNVCNNMVRTGIPILYVSIEMGYADVVYRLGAMNGETSMSTFVTGRVGNLVDEPGLKSLTGHLEDFHMCDLDQASEVEIVLLMQQHMMRYPRTGLIVIDYLQNVDCERLPRSSRHLQLSGIARYFRSAAKRLKVPVFLLSQVKRSDLPDKFRMLSVHDFKESGDIENTCDAALLINRIPSEDYDWYAWFDVCKQRQGRRGKIEMQFTGSKCSFQEQAVPLEVLDNAKIKRGGLMT